jgi:putative PEP-CTERM system TPR-repeat lipoprotein
MTKQPAALAIALAFATSPFLSGCDHTFNLTEQEHIQRAKEYEDKGDLKSSIVELKNAIQKNPDSPQARLLLGQIYLKAGLGAEAEKELTRAEELGVKHEIIQIQLGEALLQMGEYKRVLDEIQAIPQSSKINLARIQQIRADALLNLGRLKDACSLYQQALEAHTNNPRTYWGLAKCAVAEGNTAKAKGLLDTALKINDHRSMTWVYVGDLERRNNNVQAALTAYGNALKIEPDNLSALEHRASTYLSINQIEPAQKDLAHLQRFAPKSVSAYFLNALVNFHQKKYPESRDALQEVFKITPDHFPSVLLAGATAYALGSYQQAESFLNRYLIHFHVDSYARRVLAATQIKLNQPFKALEILSPLLNSDSKDVQAFSLAAEAYLVSKNYNKAMAYLDRAAVLAPENVDVKIQLAAGHLAAGESGRALTELKQATNLSTKPGEADLALIILLLQRKEFDQSLQAIDALEKKLPSNPVTLNLRAAALLGKQDRAGARNMLEKALAMQPSFYTTVVNLARIDLLENKQDAARKRFENVLKKDKSNILAMLSLADLAAYEKKDDEYIGWLEKAIQTDPKNIKPRAALARYYLFKKDYKKALSLANEAVSANPDSLEGLNLLGEIQIASGDIAASITTFTRITKKVPQSPVALLRLALAQMAGKQLDKARANLQLAIQQKPDFVQALDALIRLDIADDKPDAALQNAHRIQTQLTTSPLGFEREGDILISQKRYPQAIKAYEAALTKGAGAIGLIKLHSALTSAGDTKIADQRLNDWLRHNPKDNQVRYYAAEYFMQTSRNGEAIAQYETLLKDNPNNVLTLNNLSNLYLREKDIRALPTAEQALKLTPDSPDVLDTLGWILVKQGQLPRGLDLLRKAVNKAPKPGSVHYHYAVALAESGNKPEARKQLEKAVNSGQKFPELELARAMLKSI